MKLPHLFVVGTIVCGTIALDGISRLYGPKSCCIPGEASGTCCNSESCESNCCLAPFAYTQSVKEVDGDFVEDGESVEVRESIELDEPSEKQR